MQRAILVTFALLWPIIVGADCYDIQENIIGKEYIITIDDNEFTLTFHNESITRCPEGIVTISYTVTNNGWQKNIELDFDYSTSIHNSFLTIENFGMCLFDYEDMYVVPFGTPILKMEQKKSQSPFIW